MDKVKQLAEELYNQKVLDGWKNVSMETCLKRATDYYRIDEVIKKLTIGDVSDNEVMVCSCGNHLTEKEIFYETCLVCMATVEQDAT